MKSDRVELKIIEQVEDMTNVWKKGTDALGTLDKSVIRSGNDIKNMFNASSALGWIAVIKNAINMMIKASSAETSYIETLNLLDNAYGNVNNSGKELINTMSEQIGYDPAGLTKNLAMYRQFGNALDIDSKYANKLAENLLQMQTDVSSLYNMDESEVASKFTSALAGQTRAVRTLGADITQTTLQQEAYKLGLTESITEMSRADKTMLIYLTLQDQLSNANGDVSRTINSVANQTRIFKDQLAIAGRQIGASFIPILSSILPYLNAILMVINTLGSMILSFFGVDASKIAEEFGTATSDIDLGLDDVNNNLGNTSKAAKEAQKSLRGFDKLNVIQTPSKSSDSGGVSSSLGKINPKLLSALKDYNMQLEDMKNKATAIRDKILEWLGFSKDTNNQWKWSAETLLKNIWDWWDKLNVLGKIFVGLGLYIVISKIASGALELYNAIKKMVVLKYTQVINYFNALKELGGGTLTGTINAFIKTRTSVEKLQIAVAGLVLSAGGLLMLVSAVKDIKENGANLNNILELIIGTLALVGGAILTVAALLNGTLTPAIALATGGISLVIGAIAAVITWLATSSTSTDKATNAFKEYNKSMQEIEKTSQENADAELGKIDRVKKLSDELLMLVDSNGKVKLSDENRVNYILKEMNSAYGTEYQLIDGVITQNRKEIQSKYELKDAIDKVIEKKKAEAIYNAYANEYTEAIKNNIEAKKKLTEIVNDGNLSEDDRNRKLEEQKKIIDDTENKMTNYEKLSSSIATGTSQDMQNALDQYFNYSEDEYNKAIDRMNTCSNDMKDTINSNLNDGTNSGNEYANTYYQGFKRGLNGKSFNLGTTDGSSKSTFKFGGFKASGGFLKSAEIYGVRENGIPEMVGQIGNRPAVANNDQIVEGISVGVAKAMIATQKDTNVNIIAKGNTQGLLDFISFEQDKKNRQYGV